MSGRSLLYFVADVHLGLEAESTESREMRFLSFLKSISVEETRALYLLGDIWDFWYEYKDVIPKGHERIIAALMDLMDAGVEVYFSPGNHDLWCYSYFQSLGIRVVQQPYVFENAGKVFCVGHGDGLGPVPCGYRLMIGLFKNRVAQWLFSQLPPRAAFGLARAWLEHSRNSHDGSYRWGGKDEPLYQWAESFAGRHVDYFIFGHYHRGADETLSEGSRLIVLEDWKIDGQVLVFDSGSLTFRI